jgi:ubiquinone/menaquinone biosynthesis C-methylase UbiE
MLRKDPKERFSATASLYARWRPSYPAALRDYLLGLGRPGAGPLRIADVGCGTGISTRFLAGPGVRVIGIDPNPEMLAEARRATPAHLDLEYRTGEAVATGLEAASVELVTAAQAFHWFDVGAALAEFHRILVPGGSCAAFWNERDERASGFLPGYEALLHRFSPEYAEVSKAESTTARILASSAVRELVQVEFTNAQRLDREGLLGRAYSSSYVVHGVPEEEKPALDAALHELFDRHQEGGQIEFTYRTRVITFQIGSPSESG